jgi:hypothetical protein
MKRLAIKSVLLALLVLSTLVVVFLLPVPSSEFLSAIIDKRDLLKDGRQDRVIFVGGSGLLDGVDSGLVEERLRRPVLNMGLYIGFAITPLLSEIDPYLHAGDAIVIIPEYSAVFDTPDVPARKWLLALSPARNLPLLYHEGPHRFRSLMIDVIELIRSKLQAFPKALREAIRTRSISPLYGEGYAYFRKQFNPYGDSLRTMRAAIPGVIELRGKDLFADPLYRDQSFAAVNAFCRNARQRGIRVFYFFPVFPLDEYRMQEDGMRRFEARLRKELECTILGGPQDFLYPYDYFTNTVHHINSDARRLRTEKLLFYLEKAL